MSLDDLKTANFFHIEPDSIFYKFFLESTYPWELLDKIGDFVKAIGASLSLSDYEKVGDDVWISKEATIYEYTTIKGPTIIESGVEVRPGAFIRGKAYIGPQSVVGTATEIKNSFLIGHVEVPHYNYVGDSILAFGAHFGAGSITSNLRADKGDITVRYKGESIDTKLRKFGAIVGESAEIGCNAVLNPGVLIGEKSVVYPLSSVFVSVPAHHIHKQTGEIKCQIRHR